MVKRHKQSSKRGVLEDIIYEITEIEVILQHMRLVFAVIEDTLWKQIEYKLAKLN